MSSKWSETARMAVALSSRALGLSPNRSPSKGTTSECSDVPISLKLGEHMLVYTDHEWVLENVPGNDLREKSEQMEERIRALEKDNRILRDKNNRMTEEANLIKFKNQLLVEMLAIATLDEEKHLEHYEIEKKRSNLLKEELKSLLDRSVKAGLDLDDLVNVDKQREHQPHLDEEIVAEQQQLAS